MSCEFANSNNICKETGDKCLFIVPDEKKCYETYGEGPISFKNESKKSISNREYLRSIIDDDIKLKDFLYSFDKDNLHVCGTDRCPIKNVCEDQMHISNEIRNDDNPSLPAINALRYKFYEFHGFCKLDDLTEFKVWLNMPYDDGE